jgi:hypothetical protein
LQGELSKLVEGSVIRGLGGQLILFFGIVLVMTRSLWTGVAMAVCLAVTPFTLFGIVALTGLELDIISAPAANVARPLGIDEMIHLGYTVRRSRGDRLPAWKTALSELWGADSRLDAHRDFRIRAFPSLELPSHATDGHSGLSRRGHYRSCGVDRASGTRHMASEPRQEPENLVATLEYSPAFAHNGP